MLDLKKLSPEVYRAVSLPVHIGAADLDFVADGAKESPRQRARILCHLGNDSLMAEMFVAYGPETYVRPNKHKKDEAVFVVRGECHVVFFNDAGTVMEVFKLSTRGESLSYYCRLPYGIYHTVIMQRDTILFESTPGPFDPTDVQYASWAPEEESLDVGQFSDELDDKITAKRYDSNQCRLTRFDAKVWYSADSWPRLGKSEEDFLKNELVLQQIDRCRICTHHSNEDRLRQMLMAFRGDTYIRPSRHKQDESLYVLEGAGRYVFFDDAGNVTKVVPLRPLGCGHSMFCRIPAMQWHALVMDGDMTVLETTAGPFRREDTEFPDWSPTDGENAAAYMKSLRAKIGEFRMADAIGRGQSGWTAR
jgi:cupin fold WbuC family metalloprotein